MTPAEYSLESLLELRRSHVDAAKQALEESGMALEGLRAQLERIDAELEACAQRARQSVEGAKKEASSRGAEWQRVGQHLLALATQRERLRAQRQEGQRRLEALLQQRQEQQDALLEAQVRLQVVEKHRARWQEARRSEAQRHDETQQEEQIGERWRPP